MNSSFHLVIHSLLNAVNTLFSETIENYELEDYIEEILFNEFHTMAEDGSLPKVRICTAY